MIVVSFCFFLPGRDGERYEFFLILVLTVERPLVLLVFVAILTPYPHS